MASVYGVPLSRLLKFSANRSIRAAGLANRPCQYSTSGFVTTCLAVPVKSFISFLAADAAGPGEKFGAICHGARCTRSRSS
jgi:hypothetical protein